MPETQPKELLVFFKVLAEANRLKIVGLLAQQPYPVEQLASLLELSEFTVSHHLARLAQVGLVTARAESYSAPGGWRKSVVTGRGDWPVRCHKRFVMLTSRRF